MFLPPYLQRWLLLNALRLLTITSCALVIASTIRTLRINFTHYPPPPTVSPSTTTYYPSTDIPTHFLGVFWSTLHHLSLLLVLTTVMLSELSLPIPLLHRLFKSTLPFLGPNWGTGFLGVLLVLVAADGLSRGDVGTFAEASNWVMASAGVCNVGAGVVWRAKAKVVRKPMGWKREVAVKMEALAEAKRRAERVVDTLPLPAGVREKGKGGGGEGVKKVLGKAGKAVWKKVEERQAKKEHAQEQAKREKERSDVEMVQAETTPALSIFNPPLPSAIVSSRAAPPPATAPTANSSPKPTTTVPPPLIVPPPPPARLLSSPSRAATASTCSSTSTSSVYTLDLPSDPPTFFTSPPPSLTHTTASLPSTPPPHKPPPLKSVRFLPPPTVHHPSTTIDSLRAPLSSTSTTTEVEGSKFLLLPSPSAPQDGERSPSVLASLKAAMLEAQARATAKKSIYLGSDRWQAEYHSHSLASSHEPKSQEDKPRPYDFL